VSLLDVIRGPEEAARAEGQISGVAIGIVTDNRDPEGLARVKVRMPWLAADAESDWVKIATLYAGADRGSVWLPEVDDEVLLVFEHGDVNYPYVVGALWNTQAKPPEANADGQNNVKLVRSRSGHAVTLRDEAGRETVEIRSKGGHRIELSDAAGAERVTISDHTGQNILILESMGGQVTLKAGLRLSIEAPQVEIAATGPLTLRGAVVNIN
jgi:uncharacterized protein involved in type VI secretion and phage assembly